MGARHGRDAGTTRAHDERSSAGGPESPAQPRPEGPAVDFRFRPAGHGAGDTATGHETGRRCLGDPGRLCRALAVDAKGANGRLAVPMVRPVT